MNKKEVVQNILKLMKENGDFDLRRSITKDGIIYNDYTCLPYYNMCRKILKNNQEIDKIIVDNLELFTGDEKELLLFFRATVYENRPFHFCPFTHEKILYSIIKRNFGLSDFNLMLKNPDSHRLVDDTFRALKNSPLNSVERKVVEKFYIYLSRYYHALVQSGWCQNFNTSPDVKEELEGLINE